MASNFVVNVPKLKGRENYDVWAFAAENMLVLEGMSDLIKEESRSSSTAAADDAKAKAKLILTIEPALYVHIKQAKTTKELWMQLKTMFDDSGFTRRITLLRHLISIRLENTESMTSYVTQIIDTSQKLNGTGFKINDEWIGSLLLAGLPERFSPMIMAIEHSGIPITADIIKTKLIDMEMSESNESEIQTAFVSKGWRKYRDKTAGQVNTRKTGRHGANKSLTNPKKTVAKNITCYKCKQTGHYRNQCPMLAKSDESKQSNAFSAVFLSSKFSKQDWYIDSGASAHMTANEHWMKNASYTSNIPEVIIADKTKVPVRCSGNVEITTDCGYNITVKNILCVPNLTTNLLSVSELIKNGNKVYFDAHCCFIRNIKNELVAKGYLIDGVYKLKIKCNLQNDNSLLATPVLVDGCTWHRRLGHINSTDMNKMKAGIVDGLSYHDKFETGKSNCVVCCEGKQSRLPFTHIGERSTETLQVIHADVCGPMEVKSIGGARYFLLLVDDFSRMAFIHFLKTKGEVLCKFKEFKALVENQQNKKIKIFRTDNGCEFCNNDFMEFLKKEGIIHQKSNPYTPEQNGLCERLNRTIVEKARCLLFDANLEKKFWGEAANTAVYLKNRSISSGTKNKTPYEMWHGKKPDLSHIRIFGSNVMVHVPKEKRLKWDKKSQKHILVGYSDNIKGYRIYDYNKNKIITSRDVIIMENRIADMKDMTAELNSENTSQEAIVSVGESSQEEQEVTDEPELLNVSRESRHVIESATGTLPKRTRKPPERYITTCLSVESTEELGDDITYSEAMSGHESANWKLAVEEELKSFEMNDAWELVDTPQDSTIVQCKWVLKKKFDSDDKVRYRARLVAKGFSQKPGIDYYETFSPVVRHSTLRLLFAISVQLGLDINHLDVTTAFLNGHLKEDIFMHLPEGYNVQDRDTKVLKLKRSIYGLKQSSLAWYQRVEDCLYSLGFKKCKLEPCVFTKMNKHVKIIIALYVDDFLIFSNDAKATEHLKSVLNSNFKIKDLGRVKKYLGMRINVNKSLNVITVDQEQYIDQLLTRFDMLNCKCIDTPMECRLNLEKANNCDSSLPYQRLIGSLMYLCVMTRPDIAYCISYLSQFNNCYSDTHWNHAKRILRYLQKTKHSCLKYSSEKVELEGFVDADWASNFIDRRSYTGFCFVMSGSAISWESKKQKTVALSSTEAEYMAMSDASREAIYLRSLLYEITNNSCMITMYSDSQSALRLIVNQQSHKRSKHIDVRYHFVRETVSNKFVNFEYMQTAEMPADLLTKALCASKHYKLMEKLGIVNSNTM